MKLRLLSLVLLCISTAVQAIPAIDGKPDILAPDLLDWGLDREPSLVDLSEPTANRIADIHSDIKQCDIVLSTSGNYHMALSEIWYQHFLKENNDINNWLYTTSPPISLEFLQHGELSAGNWRSSCLPTLAVGPKNLMGKLHQSRLLQGVPIPIIKNQGNVLLIKKGNPKNITSIWDLGRENVRVVTSNPYTEPGSFGNYRDSLYNIAKLSNSEFNADKLFNQVFNSQSNGKWVSGKRIHHREVPQAIADDRADVGMMFYHLALYIKNRFPDQFDIVPLGGSIASPDPLPGNKIATLYIARIIGEKSEKTRELRENLISDYQSDTFTDILTKYGMQRP